MATAHPMLTGAVNRMLAAPSVASLARRAAGIDQRRPLPRFATQTFRNWFARHEPVQHGGGRGVLLWVDTFTDHFSPQVGVAAVRVLEAAGFSVQIPAEPQCCGLTWISTGQLGIARRLLERGAASVEGAVAQEIPVVGLEPSCTAVFRDEAAELIGRTVPVRTLAELLADVDDELLPRLDGVSALAQPHCHQHAVMGWQRDADLLRRLGARVERVGGCCGLAGNFGVVQGHYDVSVAVAETALLPAIRARADGGTHMVDDLILADGFSCRTQVDQLTGRRAVHLAELLADRINVPAGAG
jgi:Fe-S oxidoreductase